MNTQDITFALVLVAVICAIISIFVRANYRVQFVINDGSTGLLYHDGKLIAALTSGRHVRWGKNFKLAIVETRKTLLQVAGQGVLTSDNVAVKLSVVLTTQIVDAAKSAQAVDNHLMHLYATAQTAIRFVVAGFTLEALLNQRAAIGEQLRGVVAPEAGNIGVQIHNVEVRDVMLPGELRKAFSEVLKAKQEGQAALERARGESAALRNLANAARLIEGQPALATLRFLQTLETKGASSSFVMNDISALLTTLKSARGSANGSGEA